MTIDTQIGKRPISDDLPAGADIRDSAEFEQIQGEIDKLTAISGNGLVDWPLVTSLCETVLSGKSKDLLLGCYLTGGLLETQGLDGLANGLQILSDMLQTYWDSLFPTLKRIRARRNALQWLIDRISQKGEDPAWQEKPADGQLIDAILASLRNIDATLSEKDEEAPSMQPLLSLLGDFPRIEQPAAAPAPGAPAEKAAAGTAPTVPTPPQPGNSIPSAAPPAPASPPSGNDLDAGKANDLLNERISELADWYQGIDLENPTPYRLKRIALWSAVVDLPPSRNGKTFIPGPQTQAVEIMKRLEAAGSPEEIIRFAENQLSIEPFWLDMNRIVAQAMARCGSRFASAQKAVELETAHLVSRLPKLAELRFINEHPFANEATNAWLRTLGNAAAPGSASQNNDAESRAIREARTSAAAGKRVEAASRIQQEIALTKTGRQRFVLRMRLFEILAMQAEPRQLSSFASILQADIAHFNLEEWEPELALEGLKLIHRWLLSDPANPAEAAQVLARITLLDPATAVDIVATPGGN